MQPGIVYETQIVLLPEDQEELDYQVWAVLKEHRGKENRIGRRELLKEVMGLKLTKKDNISNMHVDRMVRESIERLRKREIILSSSGNGGYWLPETYKEVERYSAEIISRARKLEEQSGRMLRMASEAFSGQMKMMV